MKQQVVSKALGSATDLTLMVPIKQGMVQEYEAVSYQTRLTMFLRTLNALRSGAREQLLAPAYTDPVERIQQIHSFRLAITKTQPAQLILAVTFDHHWEPYMRVIWRDLGALLDPILCNVEGYPLAASTDYETYVEWVRRNQQNTEYFFNATSLTVSDLSYLVQTERMVRDGPDADQTDLAVAQFPARSPQEQLAVARIAPETAQAERVRQGTSALLGLFALTRYYGAKPGIVENGEDAIPNDAMLLLLGAKLILEDFPDKQLPADLKARLAGPLAWYAQESLLPLKDLKFPPLDKETVQKIKENVQKGVLTAFGDPDAPVTHGAVLMLEVVNSQEARKWLAAFSVSSEGGQAPDDGIFRSVALGFKGLERLGIDRAWRETCPQEFQQGSQVRAPQLGDLRGYHPRNWRLPRRNWPNASGGEIQMDMIDVVIQLRTRRPGCNAFELTEGHPLLEAVNEIARDASGLRLVSVQPMLTASEDGRREHFGIRDGISQPIPGGAPGKFWDDSVPFGELVLGQQDRRSTPPLHPDDFQNGGSFLVIRKMRQYLDRYDGLLTRARDEEKIARDDLVAKFLGRRQDGTPLVPNAGDNDFNYGDDPTGASCPLQSHVRRANPRTDDTRKQKPPRLMRRGMSYGRRLRDGNDPTAERGVMFMAYCASIAEQYEVVQRWINGGNSTRIGSFQPDPLIGAPILGDPPTFRFPNNGKVGRVVLNDANEQPVELQWTGYFFVPAIGVLKNLERYAQPKNQRTRRRGHEIIAQLQALEKYESARAPGLWQAVLDDAGARTIGDTAAVWEAIRSDFGGVLKCPYGELYKDSKAVLVADAAGFNQVLQTEREAYSVEGYDARALESVGSIYLGYDSDDPRYKEQANVANDAIAAIGSDTAFALAFQTGREVLADILAASHGPVLLLPNYIDNVLAKLCRIYFDVPRNDGPIVAGSLDWRPIGPNQDTERKPHCPGDYYSPSRYMFDPTPSTVGEQFGKDHGKALRAATKLMKERGDAFNGLISGRLDKDFGDRPDLFARVHVGVMMGFLPTVAGNLISVLDQWLTSGAFWRHQSSLLGNDWTKDIEKAQTEKDFQQFWTNAKTAFGTPLKQAMQQRPAPDFIWRTAKQQGRIGDVDVDQNQVVALSIYSVAQEAAANEQTKMPETGPDVSAIFGGDRRPDDHPQHACPGYKMAMGTMIGALAALMIDCTIRPLPGELVVDLSPRL